MQREGINSFRDLQAWQQAMILVIECYKLTDSFPVAERFGLTGQIRRSSCSIATNLAEGHNRKATRVFLNHVNIALGSEAELETELEIALRLNYCTREQLTQLTMRRAEIGRMLHGLAAALKHRLVAQVVGGFSVIAFSCAGLWLTFGHGFALRPW